MYILLGSLTHECFSGTILISMSYTIFIIYQVSSFETAARGTIEKEKFLAAQKPITCHKSDLVLWRDCMRRDFTVNRFVLKH